MKQQDEILVRYLQLCEAFRDSDIWSDEAKQAIELFNRGDKIIIRQCPVIALYRPLCNAVKLLEEIMDGRSFDDDVYNEVWTCANLIWCGIDGDTSVRNIFTHNDPVEINMWITEYLNYYFELDEKIDVNRDYLWIVTDRIIDRLKKEKNYV